MIRFVCDNCDKVVDTALPEDWAILQVTEPAKTGPPGSVEMIVMHVCEDHGVKELINGPASTT